MPLVAPAIVRFWHPAEARRAACCKLAAGLSWGTGALVGSTRHCGVSRGARPPRPYASHPFSALGCVGRLMQPCSFALCPSNLVVLVGPSQPSSTCSSNTTSISHDRPNRFRSRDADVRPQSRPPPASPNPARIHVLVHPCCISSDTTS